MKERRGFIEGVLVGMTLLVLIGLLFCYSQGGKESFVIVRTDTVTVRDTVIDVRPVAVCDTFIRYIKEKVTINNGNSNIAPLPKQDGNVQVSGDSVVIPITQRVYTNDSTYKAWVSGYRPILDSIEVYGKTTYITKTTVSRIGAKRWSVGAVGGIGAGLTTGKVEPFVGIGVTYRIWPN